MKTEFNGNEYWLERGRTYIDEKRTPAEFHRLQERFLFDVLRRSGLPMRRVLEIGCGFGRITKLLAQTWTDADITALDLSPEQLANARRYCGENPRVHLVQYDFYSSAPLPGGDYDTVVAIEVLLHHPPEFVVQLFKRLSSVARSIVNIDWSEDWLGPLPVHVWVHDFPKLYAEAGLECVSFPLPAEVDGKQQKLFIAGHDLPDEVKRLERSLTFAAEPSYSAAVRHDSMEHLRLATDEPLQLIPAGSRFILVDHGQWGHLRALGAYRVLPFLEKDGAYWGPPPDDATAWRELERLRRTGANHIAFAYPSFWWLEHFGEFARRLRAQFPCVLENERLVVFKLDILSDMPSSRPNTIPTVIHLLRQLKPQSILDVGVGFGKWGHLFREYTDIIEAEHEPARYQCKNWRVRIDGIEGHAAYLTPMHRFLYDHIHVGDAARLLPKLPRYDLIFLGDIIEHFEKAAGLALLADAFAKAGKAVIVSTPKFETAQEDLCGNELERHRSLWGAKDFRRFPGALVKTVDGATLLVVLPKSGIAKLQIRLPCPPKAQDTQRLLEARKQIAELVPRGEMFVLVDEEQFRETLAHTRALPFLEKDGQYWGSPADDATAIRELERLRKAGARFVVFIWTTFWWLKHYAKFERHLRSRYRHVRENEYVVAFDLRGRARTRRG